MATGSVLKAQRQRTADPIVGWQPFVDFRIVVLGLDQVDDVQTTHGPMVRVRMSSRVEYSNPDQDIAGMVGMVPVQTGGSPVELWRWGDGYWMKARDPAGLATWYKRKCYLLYPVDVLIPDGFLEWMSGQRERFLFRIP